VIVELRLLRFLLIADCNDGCSLKATSTRARDPSATPPKHPPLILASRITGIVESLDARQTSADARSSFGDSGEQCLHHFPLRDAPAESCGGQQTIRCREDIREIISRKRKEERRRSKRGVSEREIKGSEER
jgi:hypothetical protein